MPQGIINDATIHVNRAASVAAIPLRPLRCPFLACGGRVNNGQRGKVVLYLQFDKRTHGGNASIMLTASDAPASSP